MGIKENNVWEDCICGINKTVHTIECRRNHRRLYLNNFRINERKERKAKHLCASCKSKVKPKLVYPYKCNKCETKDKKYKERIKEKRK